MKALAALLLAALLAAPAAAKGITIKLATLAPKDSSYHKALLKMGQEWKRISAGEVDLIVYPGGVQGGEAAMVSRMRVNQAQAGMLTAVGLGEIEPAVVGLQSIPMVFRTLEEVDLVGAQLQPKLEARLGEKGFVTLFWVDMGWVRFFTVRPVLTPDDLKPLKLFTWAGNTEQVDLMKEVGFNPVPLETNDILPGLQTGLIQAVALPPIYALVNQVYTPAPNMLELNWAPLVGACVVTRKAWEKIPEAMRADLARAAAGAGREIKAAGRRESEESVVTMREKWGLKVQALTAEAEASWRKAVEAVYDRIRGRIVPADIFDDVQRILAEARK